MNERITIVQRVMGGSTIESNGNGKAPSLSVQTFPTPESKDCPPFVSFSMRRGDLGFVYNPDKPEDIEALRVFFLEAAMAIEAHLVVASPEVFAPEAVLSATVEG